LLDSDHALHQLWSAYIHLEMRALSAASLPNWPLRIDPRDSAPPGGKRTP